MIAVKLAIENVGMKSPISLRLMTVAVALVLATKVAYDFDVVPNLFRSALSSDIRDALGCIDENGAELIEQYRETVSMNTNVAVEPANKFLELRSMTSSASASIEAMDECYARLAALHPGLDKDGRIRLSLDRLAVAYEGIFLAQAVSISKSLRVAIGVAVDDMSKAADTDETPKPDLILNSAEVTFAELSAHIGDIVTR